MKSKTNVSTRQAMPLENIKVDPLKEFQKLNLASQRITQIKEIQQIIGNSIQEYDHRFKILLERLIFQILDVQNHEWCIMGLLPHIIVPLTQQKVGTQSDALEITIILEAIPRSEASLRMLQVQTQLAMMTVQLHQLSTCKEVRQCV